MTNPILRWMSGDGQAPGNSVSGEFLAVDETHVVRDDRKFRLEALLGNGLREDSVEYDLEDLSAPVFESLDEAVEAALQRTADFDASALCVSVVDDLGRTGAELNCPEDECKATAYRLGTDTIIVLIWKPDTARSTAARRAAPHDYVVSVWSWASHRLTGPRAWATAADHERQLDRLRAPSCGERDLRQVAPYDERPLVCAGRICGS